MVLEFTPPEMKQQRLKLLAYGEMGSGKSTICCAMPNVAYFDTEDTTSKTKYAKAIADNGGQVLHTGDIDKIIAQVKELMTQPHSFKTVVIDSITVPYDRYKRLAEKRVGSDFGRNISEADKKINELISILLHEKFDMNVIVTAHAKREYGTNMNVIGLVPNASKNIGYMFDLVLETSVLGRQFSALIKKSRLDNFETGEEIKFSYDDVVRRCGVETLEKPVKVIGS